MIETKRVEVRDIGTTMPALALRVTGGPEDRVLWRAGFSENPLVILVFLELMVCQYDPFSWGDRTKHTSHLWIQDHWEELEDAGVVDVEYILGETAAPKKSEIQNDNDFE